MPFLRELPPPEESVIVPLRWETRLQLESTEFELANTALTAKHKAYEELIKESALSFEEYATSHDEIIARYNSMLSFQAILAARTGTHIIRHTLKSFQPRKVWVPTKCLNGSTLISSQEWTGFYDFCEALRYICLAECVEGASITTFQEQSAGSNRITQMLGNLRLEDLAYGVVLKLDLIWRNGLSKRKHKSPGKLKSNHLIVIGQKSKSVELLRELKKSKVQFQYFSDVPIFFKMTTLKLRFNMGLKSAIISYLAFRETNLGAIATEITKWSRQIRSGLLTDHHYDARTRLVLDDVSNINGKAATFAEGIGLPLAKLNDLYKCWVHLNPKVMNFTESAHMTDCLAHYYSQAHLVTGGYFAQRATLRTSPSINMWPGLRGESSLTLLVSLELYRSHSQLWEEYAYEAAMRLLTCLASLPYRVYVKSRHAHMHRFLRKRFPTFSFYNSRPWYSLAIRSTVVIHSDSSIGLEALGIKKPIIVWKPFDYPMYSDAYSDIPTDVLRKVTREEDLERAIEELIQSPKRDFDKYEYFLAHEHHRVIDWAKKAVSGAREN